MVVSGFLKVLQACRPFAEVSGGLGQRGAQHVMSGRSSIHKGAG